MKFVGRKKNDNTENKQKEWSIKNGTRKSYKTYSKKCTSCGNNLLKHEWIEEKKKST